MQANSSAWDPPPIAAGAVARTRIGLAAAAAGDVVAAAHSGAAEEGMQDVALHAVVGPGNGTVTVLARNLGDAELDLPAGTLRVVLTKVT